MSAPDEPGSIVGDRYRLDELIGRGGMASVFRARDLRLDRPVAVKVLRPEILADPDLALRFRREAHAATVLRHPNVVACLDTGRDGDRPFLVMELIEGEDLAARLRREPRLPVAVATRIARDVARGLAIAHARGIVHRDVKPGNILLAADGRALVTDFGIARIAAEAEATLPGTTLGSVHYFSPEQAQGTTTTPASDVYSLGLVLFEMLTGTRPFAGDSPAAIAVARVDAPAPSVRAVDPSIPAALEAVVGRALAPDPTRRYPNGGMLADALDSTGIPGASASAVDPSGDTRRVVLPPPPPSRPPGHAPAPRPGPAPVILPLPAAARPPTGSAAAGPARVLTGVAVAAGALVVLGAAGVFAMLGGEPDVAALDATPTPALATPATTDEPTDEPEPTAEPPGTDTPSVTPVPPGEVADLCEPDPGTDTSCALGAGSYRPSRFEPAFDVDLDEGWAAFRHSGNLVVLERADGYLALASEVETVFDGDEELQVRSSARELSEAIAGNEALEVLAADRERIFGRRAFALEVVPVGGRTPIFRIGDDTYYAETTTVTRLYAFEIGGRAVVVVLEGAGGSDLATFLDGAGAALDSIAFT